MEPWYLANFDAIDDPPEIACPYVAPEKSEDAGLVSAYVRVRAEVAKAGIPTANQLRRRRLLAEVLGLMLAWRGGPILAAGWLVYTSGGELVVRPAPTEAPHPKARINPGKRIERPEAPAPARAELYDEPQPVRRGDFAGTARVVDGRKVWSYAVLCALLGASSLSGPVARARQSLPATEEAAAFPSLRRRNGNRGIPARGVSTRGLELVIRQLDQNRPDVRAAREYLDSLRD